MGLTKYKIGQIVTIVDERNALSIREFYGININKEFMPTVANTEGLDETKYKVVRRNRFVYSGMLLKLQQQMLSFQVTFL